MTEPTSTFATLQRHARDAATGWSLGIFGAIAEFMRVGEEPARVRVEDDLIEIVTDRGGLRVLPDDAAIILDYEMPSRHEARRVRALAACLPMERAARAGRSAVTEIGPDAAALREEDRDAMLFDLGIGLGTVEACIRTRAPELITALRAAQGETLFGAQGLIGSILAHAPPRVFISALGRIEVYQAIPPVDGRSPDGPHTHVLPKLLAHRRTHAANIPIPESWVPCLSIHPPHGAAVGRA